MGSRSSHTEALPARGRWRCAACWVLVGLLLGGLAATAWEAGEVVLGGNLHTVIEGQVYRSAQLSESGFRDVVRAKQIRTVVNLRGSGPEATWYQDECRVLDELGVARYDIAFPNYMPPGVPQMRQLLEVLEHGEYPILLHCRRGADRTGLAAAMAMLIRGDATIQQARAQLSWRYGHLPLFRMCGLDDVLPMYDDWLARLGASHRPALFRRWILEDYRPGQYWADIEPLDVPKRLALGQRHAARFRVHNRSYLPWQFKQSPHCGVHLHYWVRQTEGAYETQGAAGYFDAVVPPGQSVDLALNFPAFRVPGRYSLVVDLADEQYGWFLAAGSKPFTMEFEVENPRDVSQRSP